MKMKWAFSGNCDDEHCDGCYWNSQSEGDFFDTKELAEKAAEDHFPGGNMRLGPFRYEVFEVEQQTGEG